MEGLQIAIGIVLVGFLFRFGWGLYELVEIWIYNDREDEQSQSPT